MSVVLFPAGTTLLVRGVPDRSGRNLKTRPVLLVAPLLEDDVELFAVAVTTSFDVPIREPLVEMRFSRAGDCVTGLDAPAVAHALWQIVLPPSAIIRRLGFAGSRELDEVVTIIRKDVASRHGGS